MNTRAIPLLCVLDFESGLRTVSTVKQQQLDRVPDIWAIITDCDRKTMSNFSLLSQFLIIIFAAIACIVVGLDVEKRASRIDQRPEIISDHTPTKLQNDPTNPLNNVQTPKIAPPNPPTEKIETSLPSAAKTIASSADLATYKTTPAFEQYQPKYIQVTIDPSNYGDRYSRDVHGNTLDNLPLVVLHETTNSVMSAINTFRTSHSNDSNQVSYHALIALNGTIIYLVPSDKRAFGAGNSEFESSKGIETVKTNPNLPSSVNNFAYHISLETPLDGRGEPNQKYHSGYTENQYKSLAWLLALSDIPDNRITTHQNVDRSNRRFDPRSFDFERLFQFLHAYRQPAANVSTPN